MTITEYAELINRTKLYDNRKALVYGWIKDIIEVASQMKYNHELHAVSAILKKYSVIKTTKIDDQKVAYIIIETPESVKEQIINLRNHVFDQRERDISEGIVTVR